MDYSTIATLSIAAVSPLIAKGLEKLAEKTAEEGFNERRAILSKIKGLFQPDHLTFLNLLEESTKNPDLNEKLTDDLKGRLESDPELANEFEFLLMKLYPEKFSRNTSKQIGNNNISIQGITSSTINIGNFDNDAKKRVNELIELIKFRSKEVNEAINRRLAEKNDGFPIGFFSSQVGVEKQLINELKKFKKDFNKLIKLKLAALERGDFILAHEYTCELHKKAHELAEERVNLKSLLHVAQCCSQSACDMLSRKLRVNSLMTECLNKYLSEMDI